MFGSERVCASTPPSTSFSSDRAVPSPRNNHDLVTADLKQERHTRYTAVIISTCASVAVSLLLVLAAAMASRKAIASPFRALHAVVLLLVLAGFGLLLYTALSPRESIKCYEPIAVSQAVCL